MHERAASPAIGRSPAKRGPGAADRYAPSAKKRARRMSPRHASTSRSSSRIDRFVVGRQERRRLSGFRVTLEGRERDAARAEPAGRNHVHAGEFVDRVAELRFAVAPPSSSAACVTAHAA